MPFYISLWYFLLKIIRSLVNEETTNINLLQGFPVVQLDASGWRATGSQGDGQSHSGELGSWSQAACVQVKYSFCIRRTPSPCSSLPPQPTPPFTQFGVNIFNLLFNLHLSLYMYNLKNKDMQNLLFKNSTSIFCIFVTLFIIIRVFTSIQPIPVMVQL